MGQLRVCADCHELTDQTRCEAHRTAQRARTKYDEDPRYGRKPWKVYRDRFKDAHPFCAIKGPGCTLVTDVVDHILPVRTHPHLFDDPSNHRPACQWCNQWVARTHRGGV